MNVLRRLAVFLMAIAVGVATPVSTYALDEEQMNFYAQNNILFYDPDGGDKECGAATINGNNVTIIGDSISFGAKSEYASRIPGADFESKTFDGVTYNLVEVSKHFAANDGSNYSGMTIAEVLQNQGALNSYVVFALGTNDPGAVTEAKIGELMDLIGTNHRVVLVTNYAYDNKLDYSVNNAAIRAAKDKYDNVAVADWAAELSKSSDPLEYIGDEYVHPNANGNKLFVKLIKQALDSLAGGIGGVNANYNRNYAGVQVWSDESLSAIAAHQAIYAEAASKYNFPWQVLAILHMHETGLRLYNPDNGQGVYQLYSYTDGGTNENRFEPADSISVEEFRRQTLIAAEVVSEMAGDLNDPDNVKLLFFKYNGTASQYIDRAIAMGFSQEEANNGEGSPYVMNRYDERRDPTSANMSPHWKGRFVGDGEYDPEATTTGFGAFVQYEALGGGGGAYCTSGGNGKIADAAIELAWSVEEWATKGYSDSKRCLYSGTQYPQCIPKDTYSAAMSQVGNHYAGSGHSDYFGRTITVSIGASCDQFVATVMRYSGADPEFKLWNAGEQFEYMAARPEMYSRIDASRIDDLRPGDIFVNNGHIVLYVGLVNGKETVAEASFGMYTGRLSSDSWYISDLKNNGRIDGYNVFRRINLEGN